MRRSNISLKLFSSISVRLSASIGDFLALILLLMHRNALFNTFLIFWNCFFFCWWASSMLMLFELLIDSIFVIFLTSLFLLARKIFRFISQNTMCLLFEFSDGSNAFHSALSFFYMIFGPCMAVCSAMNQDTLHTNVRTSGSDGCEGEIVRFLTNQKLLFGRRCNCYFTISLLLEQNKKKLNTFLLLRWFFFSKKGFFFPFETVGKFYQKKMNFWDV